MKLRCMHTARSSLSIFLFHSPSVSFLACSPHASPSFRTPLLPPAQPKLNALAVPTPLPFAPSLFRRFFFLSLTQSARTPLRLLLPALSHLLHCHPFPTFCSLTNRAAREYIFYRHSWWPPHICANLPAGLPLACLGQARPLRTRAIPDLPRLTLRCFSYSLQLQSHTIQMRRKNN